MLSVVDVYPGIPSGSCFLHPEQFLGGAGESQQLPQTPHLVWGPSGSQGLPGLCESLGSQGLQVPARQGHQM